MTVRESADVLVVRRPHLALLLREVREGARELHEDTGAYVADQLDAEARALRLHATTRAQWAAADKWLRQRAAQRRQMAADLVAEAAGLAMVQQSAACAVQGA